LQQGERGVSADRWRGSCKGKRRSVCNEYTLAIPRLPTQLNSDTIMGMEEAIPPLSTGPEAADGGIPYPIVGIGSSTGGLEPLKSLLRSMTPEQDKALVIVQHLSPACASALAEILLASSKTEFPPDEGPDVGRERTEPTRECARPGDDHGLDHLAQRKRTEAALRESEERLRLSQEAAHIGNFDWDLETGVKVWSPELELLYGLPPGGFPQTREAWESLLHPDDRERALASVEHALETGELVEEEWRVIWPDGSEHWLAARFQAYPDGEGRPVRIVGVNLDITCRKWSEEALRASEAIKTAILDSALDAIFTLDHQGHLVGFNPAAERIFGYAREEVLGRPMGEVLLPERLHEQNRRGFAHFLATGDGPVLDRVPALRADGTEFPAEMSIVAVPGSDPPLFTGFLRDVTERKQMEDSLRERADALARADRNKDEFLAMLAHELRNPLAPLRNAAEILAADQTTVEENAHARRVIVRQIENMSRMLDDLLDVSRLTKGRIDLRTKSVSLGAILTAATSQVRAGCTTRGQQVSLTLPSQPVHLEADPTRLEQIFVNLLGNAGKYSGDGSRIEVIAEREAPDASADPAVSYVRVTVRDNGAGIAPELLPHVFDLFVQASRTLDRQHGGLGIGLTLVRRLVELHGGTVEAYSEGLGKGTAFVVRLPILAGAPAPSHHPPPPVAGETPRRILIVDDNEDSANSLAVLHSHRGHVTRTAFTGPDGVTAAAEFQPDVILLDIGLPWMDGFEVARRIRALPGMEDTLLIAMSGYGRKEDRDAAAEAGFNHYLVKPMDLDRLRQLLQEHFTASA
jgi:PAS domain S-box-containing protein